MSKGKLAFFLHLKFGFSKENFLSGAKRNKTRFDEEGWAQGQEQYDKIRRAFPQTEYKVKVLPGKIAYDLYQQDGFPRDLIETIGEEEGFIIDEGEWMLEERKHKQQSKGEKRKNPGPHYRVDKESWKGERNV